MLVPEQILIAGAIIFFLAVVAFFVKRRRKNTDTANESEIVDIEQSAIKNYEIVEVSPNMSELTKWTTLIKNTAKQIYNAKNFSNEADALWKIADESERPLLVLVMGEFSTGKSTFINTLLREDILTVDNLPATAVVTLLTFGTEKTAKIHYLNGAIENYDITKLQEITAEGDESQKALRDKIEYVELTYPNELLKKITIVDTPGKNDSDQHHNQSTENFKARADMVIWLFNARKTAKRSEIAEIEELGKRLKPLAVINKIDDIDENEDIEEKIQIVRKKLGDRVGDILGISAKKANEALKTGNENLLAESRWEKFINYVQSQIAVRSETLKIKSIYDKLVEFMALLDNSVKNQQRALKEKEKYFTNTEESKQNLLQSINYISEHIDYCKERISLIDQMQKSVNNIKDFQSYGNLNNVPSDLIKSIPDLMDMELQVIQALDNLKDFLAQFNGGSKLVSDIEIYTSQAEREEINSEEWFSGFSRLNDMKHDLDDQASHINTLTKDYKTSGIFGGEPVFDFSGRRARLNETITERNSNVEQYNLEREQHWNKGFNMIRHWYDLDKEVRKLYERIINFLTDENKKYSTKLENLRDNFETEKEKYNQNLKSLNYAKQILSSLRHILNENLQSLDLNQIKAISSLVIQNAEIPKPEVNKKEIATKSNATNSNRGATAFLVCVFGISILSIGYLFFESPSNFKVLPTDTQSVKLDKKTDSVNKTEEKPKFVTPTQYKPFGKDWLKDKNGVYIYDTNDKSTTGISITWSGSNIEDGNYRYANGYGVVTYYLTGSFIGTIEGNFNHGKRHGRFKHKSYSGEVYYTNWDNGVEITSQNTAPQEK